MPYKKVNSKWVEGLNVKAKIIKLSAENIGVNLLDIGLGNGCLDMTPKAQATKEKINDIIKIKNFCASKNIIKKVEE